MDDDFLEGGGFGEECEGTAADWEAQKGKEWSKEEGGEGEGSWVERGEGKERQYPFLLLWREVSYLQDGEGGAWPSGNVSAEGHPKMLPWM